MFRGLVLNIGLTSLHLSPWTESSRKNCCVCVMYECLNPRAYQEKMESKRAIASKQPYS